MAKLIEILHNKWIEILGFDIPSRRTPEIEAFKE